MKQHQTRKRIAIAIASFCLLGAGTAAAVAATAAPSAHGVTPMVAQCKLPAGSPYMHTVIPAGPSAPNKIAELCNTPGATPAP